MVLRMDHSSTGYYVVSVKHYVKRFNPPRAAENGFIGKCVPGGGQREGRAGLTLNINGSPECQNIQCLSGSGVGDSEPSIRTHQTAKRVSMCSLLSVDLYTFHYQRMWLG